MGILRGLEEAIEHFKPFLPRALGGYGGVLFSENNPDASFGHTLLTRDIGENPLIFLDTSAVIDFEKICYDTSLGQSGKDKPRDCSRYLETLSQTQRIIIPSCMVEELEKHRNCFIGRRKEISDKTFEVVNKIDVNSKKIMKSAKTMNDREKIRLDVYWATKECFRDNHKKDVQDRISDNDKNLVVDAIHYKNSKINGKEITSSLIYSLDSHIHHLVYFLKNQEYDYQGIFARETSRDKNGRYGIH